MKKILLTATVLACMTALTKAQQGRVGINTTTPATTLDVAANLTDATRPDALLVPRMTEDQLAAKNTAYADGTATPSAQNGALVFVTAVDGATTAKTVNVTATGFYYYDGTTGNNVWKTVGAGGAAAAPVTYRSTPGAAIITINPSDVGNVVLITAGPGGNIQLPTPTAAMVGKKLTIIEIAGVSQGLTNLNPTYKTNTLGVLQQFGSEFITDGTNWYGLGGQ